MAITNHERVGKALERRKTWVVQGWPKLTQLALEHLQTRSGADQRQLL